MNYENYSEFELKKNIVQMKFVVNNRNIPISVAMKRFFFSSSENKNICKQQNVFSISENQKQFKTYLIHLQK